MANLKFKGLDGIDEVTVTKIMVKVGDEVKLGQQVLEVEADKASDVINADEAGTVTTILINEGDVLTKDTIFISFDEMKNSNSEPTSNRAEVKSKPEVNTPTTDNSGIVLASPFARAFATKNNVVLAQVIGTGPANRVLKTDIENYLSGNQNNHAVSTPKTSDQAVKKPSMIMSTTGDKDDFGPILIEKITPLRKSIAKAMTNSLYTAPHVALMMDIDAEKLIHLRQELKTHLENQPSEKPVKLTFLPFFIKAVAVALKQDEFRYLNAVWDETNNNVIVKKYYNIGMATDTDKGLFVPVIKNADELSILEIANEVNNFANKAKTSAGLTGPDMTGGTFTITNFGSAGLKYGAPIIRFPETAILGIGMLELKPVLIDGKVEHHRFFPMSISIDHRAVDGAPAGRFLGKIRALLEAPLQLLI